MEGRILVINSSEDLSSIDGEILNALCDGLDIHILSTNHMVCEVNQVMFTNYINNNNTSKRVIFIPDSMIDEFQTIEHVYYTESRETMDPLDRFKWHCPVCHVEFDNM